MNTLLIIFGLFLITFVVICFCMALWSLLEEMSNDT